MERLHAINGLSLELVLKIVKIITQIHLGENLCDLTPYIDNFLISQKAVLEHLENVKIKIFFPAANHGVCRTKVNKV